MHADKHVHESEQFSISKKQTLYMFLLALFRNLDH